MLAGVLAAACGDSPQPVEGPNGLSPPIDAGPATSAQPGSPTPGSPADGGSPTPTAGGGTSGAGSGAGPGTTERTRADGSDSIAEAARTGVGGFARTLLQPAAAERIVVDVVFERGAGPSRASLDHTLSTLRTVTGKPVTTTATAVDAAQQSWTGAELRALADDSAPTKQGEETAALRVLFVRGGLADNDAAVGVAVRADVLAVFADRLDETSSPLVPRSRLEEAVLMHEIGHLLGLVDLVIDTGRDDPEHPGHSRNTSSVMYWAVESTLVGQALNGPPPTEFDSQDRQDLASIRSGA